MATIDKRIGSNGTVTWRARVRVEGQSRTKSFKRKTDAKTWATRIESELQQGAYVPKRGETNAPQ